MSLPKIFALSGILIFCFALRAPASDYSKQPVHERVLIGETQKGAYVMGFYNSDMDVVRLTVCGENGPPHSDCRPLIKKELRYGDLPFYEKRLLEKLSALKEKLIRERKNSLLAKVVGGPDRDVEAVDKAIRSLKEEGLRGWILHKTKARPASPNVSSSQIFKDILGEAEETFAAEPPKAAPSLDGGTDKGHR